MLRRNDRRCIDAADKIGRRCHWSPWPRYLTDPPHQTRIATLDRHCPRRLDSERYCSVLAFVEIEIKAFQKAVEQTGAP
jgi:hypothetical protein